MKYSVCHRLVIIFFSILVLSFTCFSGYAQDINLKDHAEELTSVSAIRDMGITGKGVTIAFIDTGLDKSHEQFGDRVIAEQSFINGVQSDSSFPQNPINLTSYNHGSHVAGIAAGMEGLASDANIIMVNILSETYDPEFVTESNPDGYRAVMLKDDLYQAISWLLEIQESLMEEGNPISIVYVGFSEGDFDHFCDNDDEYKALSGLFKALTDQGIIIVAGTGDGHSNTGISYPACMTNVAAVSALADISDPKIASYSNYGFLTNILAPGSNLYSAVLTGTDGDSCTQNCYGTMTGTSQAAAFVSGALALLMEAYPGMAPEDYVQMLSDMSGSTANQRNSSDPEVISVDDGTGETLPYPQKVVNFSAFFDNDPNKPTVNSMNFFLLTGTALPGTGFSMIRPSVLPSLPQALEYSSTGLTLQIPKLNITEEILTVPLYDGGYPVDWLGSSIGLLDGSSLPGEGISVLTGHNHLNTMEAGPFAFLSYLEENDRIMVTDTDLECLRKL